MQSGRRAPHKTLWSRANEGHFPHDHEEDAHHKAQKTPLPRRQRGESGENGGESRLPVAKKREAGGETLISGVRRPL